MASRVLLLFVHAFLLLFYTTSSHPLRRQDDTENHPMRKPDQEYSVKKYDQRQDGELNIQAHLDKIVLLIIPSKQINFLDYSIKGQFEHLEDIASLLSKEQPLNEVKFKQSVDEVKLISLKEKEAATFNKDKELSKEPLLKEKELNNKEKDSPKEPLKDNGSSKQVKDTLRDRIEPKIPKPDQKLEFKIEKKPNEIPVMIQNIAKKVDTDIIKISTLPDGNISVQRKPTSKSEGRTYQVVQSNPNGDIVAVSPGNESSKEDKSVINEDLHVKNDKQ